jgi:CRP-like cAMP-binding protein
MYEVFFENINKKVALTNKEQEAMKPFLISKKLSKNKFLLQEGDDCKFIAFVLKGALRQYSQHHSGSIHIVQFAIEGWTIGDLYSFLTGENSDYNIDALEDSELVLIERNAHEQMLKIFPKYETYTRLQITNAYIAMQKRLNAANSLALEERYVQFTTLYPSIAQRVPQHMIASYLGIQPATLSRIRKKMSVGNGA